MLFEKRCKKKRLASNLSIYLFICAFVTLHSNQFKPIEMRITQNNNYILNICVTNLFPAIEFGLNVKLNVKTNDRNV
jgi:hypothetical protein